MGLSSFYNIFMLKCKGYFTVELKKCATHMQPPAMGTFGASNATGAANLVDRVAPMPSMVALVSIFCLSTQNDSLCGAPNYYLYFCNITVCIFCLY